MTSRGPLLPPVDRIEAEIALIQPGQSRAANDVVLQIDHGTGSLAAIAAAGRSARLGGKGRLVLPALANAHDHGRGLPTLAYGAVDQALELWVPLLGQQPAVDPELLAGLALAKQARGGVGAVVHFHNPQRAGEMVEEAAGVIRAASAVGIRLAFVVPLADRNHLGYGPAGDVLAHAALSDRPLIADRWGGTMSSVAEQLAEVGEIAAAASSPLVSVQYGPVAPQWCTDELLERVAEEAARTGRRVHMHLLETRYQREWADAAYPAGLVRHLDQIGLLSPRLTVGHGVWLTDEELTLLAERRVIVAINTSSNLRLRSGIARVGRMLELDVQVAFGLDGLSLDDDEDMLRELQLTHLLHAGVGLEEGVTAGQVLQGAVAVGPATVVDGRWGTIEPGALADLLVVDRATYATDVADGLVDERELLLGRCRARHVQALVVAGRIVARDGRVLGVDEDALAAEVAARCRAAAGDIEAGARLTAAYQAALRRFYDSGGHREASPRNPQAVAR